MWDKLPRKKKVGKRPVINMEDPVLSTIFKSTENTLNWIWDEGTRATENKDFREREVGEPDEFNMCCDACQTEIEFICFQCLSCRSYYLCEECFMAESQGTKHAEANLEHDFDNHCFMRAWDF